MKRLLAVGLVLGLAACASGPGSKSDPNKATASKPARATPGKSPYPAAKEDLSKRGHYTAGGLYAPHIKDSAPNIGIDVSLIPEPEVVDEPLSAYGNRPTYAVLGKKYRVLDNTRGFVERGTASYYGNKFHGRRTSNMEVYDMYAFTAAHKSLPLPSFARVTNLDNGESVVVRVNDRGPFHDGRVVDLSYAAAIKLGIDRAGTGRVEVKALQPGKGRPQLAAAPTPAPAPAPSPAATPAGVATSMDSLVATLPEGETVEDWRFHLNRDGRTLTADDFDAWMAERNVHVASDGTIRRNGAAVETSAPAGVHLAAKPGRVVTAPAPSPAHGSVILQVASFAARDNADRALATLRGAGIDGANLHDGTANGRRIWRLRVGPLEDAAANGLASRIAGLGFDTPHRVTE